MGCRMTNKDILPSFKEFLESVGGEQQIQGGLRDHRARNGRCLQRHSSTLAPAVKIPPLQCPLATCSNRDSVELQPRISHAREFPLETRGLPEYPGQVPASANVQQAPVQHINPHVRSAAVARLSSYRTTRSPGDDKKYMCPVCKKSFSRPSAVEAHMPSHTGERPYLCTHKGCTKSFTTKSNMRRHCQTHAPCT